MQIRNFLLVGCGLVLAGSLAVGCGSKSNAASSPTAESAASSTPAPASYTDTSNAQAQRYNEAMKRSGTTKSPYSR